jgi:hypothetical protein
VTRTVTTVMSHLLLFILSPSMATKKKPAGASTPTDCRLSGK